jgi:calcium-dependent protein kinase
MGNTTPTINSKKRFPINVKHINDLKTEIRDILKPIGSLHTNLVTEIKRDVQQDYEQVKLLGGGKMGLVYTARKISQKGVEKGREMSIHNGHDERYAIKQAAISKKSAHFLECLRKEIKALKSLDHPNIVKPYHVYTPKMNVQLVFQFCSGGNLYSRYPIDDSTGEKIPYSEKDTARIITQLLSAVAHVHACGFTHRDIKFENIIFESAHPDAEIKLIDFGLAQDIDVMVECCGTTYTMAREVLTLKGYTNKVDMWSVGVIVYMMLSLTKPFYGRNKMIITNKIMKGDFRYYSPRWENVSSSAKNFIEALMEKDPNVRLSAVQALDHTWLKKEYSMAERIPSLDTLKRIYRSLISYMNHSTLKKVVLLVIAHYATTEEVKDLRKAFNVFDKQKTGKVNFGDFLETMRKIDTSCSNDSIRKCFDSVNIHHDGKIWYTEFLAATLESEGCISYDSLEIAFQRLSGGAELSGCITRENVKDIMGADYHYYKMDTVWKVYSYKEEITFDSFVGIVQGEEKAKTSHSKSISLKSDARKKFFEKEEEAFESRSLGY